MRLAQGAGCRFVTPPQGLFGWVDIGVDTDALAQLLLDEGWLIAPGALFHATPRPTTLMRINFATAQDARVLARAAAGSRSHFARAEAARRSGVACIAPIAPRGRAASCSNRPCRSANPT